MTLSIRAYLCGYLVDLISLASSFWSGMMMMVWKSSSADLPENNLYFRMFLVNLIAALGLWTFNKAMMFQTTCRLAQFLGPLLSLAYTVTLWVFVQQCESEVGHLLVMRELMLAATILALMSAFSMILGGKSCCATDGKSARGLVDC